jgi:hypothetical protein
MPQHCELVAQPDAPTALHAFIAFVSLVPEEVQL